MDIREISISFRDVPESKGRNQSNLRNGNVFDLAKNSLFHLVNNNEGKKGPSNKSIVSNPDDSLSNLDRIKRVLLTLNKALEIEIDRELNIPIYKIIDITTKEVLKQIPLEDIVDFKRALYEYLKDITKDEIPYLKGLLLEKEV